MIPQNELRIGNFIFDDENRVCKISCLFSDKKIKYEGYEMDDFQVEYEKNDNIYVSLVINPILLTEDWLIRFGVKSFRNNTAFRLSDTIDLNLSEAGYMACKSNSAVSLLYSPIKYVHQLQNLYFVLIGEELAA